MVCLSQHYGKMQRALPTFDNLKVSGQGLFEDRVPEETALWDIAHKELDDNRELMNRLVEPRRSLGWGCPTNRLLKVCVRGGIVQLDSLDTAQVVMVSCMLRITGGGRKCGLGNKLVRLVIQAVVKVAPQDAVDERSLRLVVVTQRCGALRR